MLYILSFIMEIIISAEKMNNYCGVVELRDKRK